MPDIKSTDALIEKLHHEQVDKLGKPYVHHPRRVMENVKKITPHASDDVLMAALLHDTIEDCGIDEDYLMGYGYSEDCVRMVRLLTRMDDDPRTYMEFIGDIAGSGNHDAIVVKIADNMDNLRPERIHEFEKQDVKRAKSLAKRYQKSLEKLCIAAHLKYDDILKLITQS